ncbi:Arc family DNA-binding protein [Paracoccus nototheniae]|uniref:Arc family DNA-binding protein n=1 Tax=Paracoccus nototheniae TaxID=2489002 RepID=A0ABW4E2R5_9RHOB|nr:Arc family DNA-binding protein [Paracoccus nototheniae]
MIQSAAGSEEVVATSLRMPKDVRDALKIQAIRAGRSYNTHAVMILSAALTSHEKDRQGGYPDGLEQSQLSERI